MTSRAATLRSTSLPLAGAAIIAGGLLAGCFRQAGPPRYTVSGTVTFRDEPVPVGTIAFEPDASRGNSGPAGYADIVDGRFRTHLGAVGGPHIVRINGARGPMVDEARDQTLFSDYRTTCDLPRQSTTLDFDVPPPKASRRR